MKKERNPFTGSLANSLYVRCEILINVSALATCPIISHMIVSVHDSGDLDIHFLSSDLLDYNFQDTSTPILDLTIPILSVQFPLAPWRVFDIECHDIDVFNLDFTRTMQNLEYSFYSFYGIPPVFVLIILTLLDPNTVPNTTPRDCPHNQQNIANLNC